MDVLSFYQALLFHDRSKLQELGPAMWAAFKEMEEIFKLTGTGARFRRLCLNDPVPGPDEPETGPDWKEARQAIESEYAEDRRG